jgi:hypothetical protein
MGGKTSATLMSSDGGVYIGGAKQVHIGGGDGSGFGYLASKASARLGKLSQTSNMKTTKLDGSEQIKIEDGKAIELRMHDTIIKMQKTKTEHKSKTINVKADKVSISAGKILLD